MNGALPDTVAAAPDSEGFVSIFNGTDLTGWWEDCQTHTINKTVGGIWIVDPSQHILYSKENGADGDILVTNKKYDNYEIILDVWPTYGNDGGVFNRVTPSGSCWQSTIDYISGSSVGGSYNEKSWRSGTVNDDPYLFVGSTAANPTISTWTTFTKDLNPTSFGCSAGGCVTSDFEKTWDVNGWNQFRVKFYNGLTVGSSVTMENFFRKVGAPNWVPTYKKSEAIVTPANGIALQIHGAGRWKAGTYNLYRNIKVRPLNADGTPKAPPTHTDGGLKSAKYVAAPSLKLANGTLIGSLDADYDITLSDVRGHVLEKFHGSAGNFRHALSNSVHGVLIADLKSKRGVAHLRFSRL
ncbi:MAG: family 16 glycoside hydrolase [Fibrobacteria bacterium]